ncbi:translin-associated factor X-interacting protein 1 [Cololabis saira]|uniref:translin-associated factor X-interacting protein 1 n=1 Tax=Cololabis saira TaxID=129043 RepID=UPI002AD3DD55|nr:translin-associated factor X-interacting protein 1 [Cololabis saira]
MEERKKTMPTVVDHLQSGLSSCYLEYQDASRLLIQRLSELGGNSVTTERPADENTEGFKNPVGLQLAPKVCREELKKTQEELISIKADYRVLQCSLETLNQNHEQTLLQLKTLQGDVEQLESDYDTLLQSHKRNGVKTKTYVSTAVQVDLLQSGLSSCYLEYRDASRLLIQRLSELGGNSVTTERPADENTGRP